MVSTLIHVLEVTLTLLLLDQIISLHYNEVHLTLKPMQFLSQGTLILCLILHLLNLVLNLFNLLAELLLKKFVPVVFFFEVCFLPLAKYVFRYIDITVELCMLLKDLTLKLVLLLVELEIVSL